MTVYHINRGIGQSSSGIEYAQKYRFDLVKDFPEEQYFVFCDYIYSNYTRFTDNIGIDMDFTLNAYKFMAGQKNHRSTYSLSEFEKTLTKEFKKENENERSVDFKNDKSSYKVWFVPETKMIDRVDMIFSGALQEVAHYSDRLTSIDYYHGKEIFCRYFYDEDGQRSMRQFLHENKIILTLLGDKVLQGSSEFYQEFFKRLEFSKEDLVIMDRNTDLASELFQNKSDSTFVVVVHAEHFSKRMTDEQWVLWNNYYEYVFVNHQYIDYFIVSTDKQKEKLQHQFEISGNQESKILTIPVGTISQLSEGKNLQKNKYKFLTASRLASEKHIDILVQAVARVKEEIPEIEFDIYGAGSLEKNLKELINKLEAQDYIRLKGHYHLNLELYEQYGAYLTASGSEGFGLTILEALAASLPIVGLNVDYGNTEFIKNKINGYLIEPKTEEEQILIFSEKIKHSIRKLDRKKVHHYSKEKATNYLSEYVSQQWRDFYDLCLKGDKK
ncbi:MAG: glycosyltransferase [Lactovum sp.]